MFGKLKQQRRITTRHDKTVLSFESFLNLTAARLWLKAFANTAWAAAQLPIQARPDRANEGFREVVGRARAAIDCRTCGSQGVAALGFEKPTLTSIKSRPDAFRRRPNSLSFSKRCVPSNSVTPKLPHRSLSRLPFVDAGYAVGPSFSPHETNGRTIGHPDGAARIHACCCIAHYGGAIRAANSETGLLR